MRPVRTWRALMIACALCAVGASPALAGPAYTPITGSPFAASSTLTTAWTAALNPTGTLLATPDFFGGSVTMFKVDPGSGTMTSLGATKLTTVANGQIGNPLALAFANAGATSYLAVVGGSSPNNVALYSVGGAGTLTLIKALAFGDLIEGVAFNSAGTMLAVGTLSGTVQMYTVSPTDLVAGGSATTIAAQRGGLAFSPDGTLLAATDFNTAQVDMYRVHANATLTSAGASTPTGTKPAAVAFSPSGGLLAVANFADSSVSMYTVAGSGALTSIGSASQTAASPVSVAFSATGRLLATANRGDDSLSLFSVAQTGSLTPLSGSPMPTGTGRVPQAVVFGPTGWLAASSLSNGAIAVFAPAAPSATISSPAPGAHTYAIGAVVGTAFTCADSTFGPGIASCRDSGGSASPGRLSTGGVGAHTYTVTARSSDGQTSQAALGYRVAAKPSVSITTPRSGRTYRIRQRVSTAFGCREGAGGPGLVTCADSGGVSASHGRLDTTHFGRHSYSVTAISADGLQTLRSIAFRVAAAPSVTIGSPVAGAHYAVGQRVMAQYGCADGLGGPGIASCHGTAPRGRRINTSRAGRYRFTVVARSKDGLRATQSVVYSVG